MKCPKCQLENLLDARFCNGCGQQLELACPECGKTNPPGSRFCNGCGHSLFLPSETTRRGLSFDEKLKKIQKYLPKGITEKILSQRERIEGEHRHITVMFCDMEGFTSLSEKLGPEEMYGLMDQIYEILIHKVHEYEGTVNELTGDGIMAIFGAPIALEDAPQRSIRSALAIHSEITRFSERMSHEKGIRPIKMRIGINSGPVVVGTVGNDLRVDFKAIGDTVNLASRMEGLAAPGATYVTESTFKLTEGFFRFEALGQKKVKGKEEPVNVYQVIAPSTKDTRFDVGAERGLTPLVGKERGLELLLDSFERLKEGRGQAFSIMGEAGLGKSRILYEFKKMVANNDVTFLEGKCLSYAKNVPYQPITDILKANFDIKEGDSDPEIREKVTRGMKLLGVDEESKLPYVLELLSVKDSGIDNAFMSPAERKHRINEVLKQIVLKVSEIRPLIVSIEDLHWMDKSSEDILKSFLEIVAGARVLLIFTYRPDFVHTWGGKFYYNQINLNRLSNRESLSMVEHLLGTQEIDEELKKAVLEKTEGIPFFIEELLKSLKDLKIIERENNKYQLTKEIKAGLIPSTIQDIIMARVDLLPEEAKTVLQIGSVIEREFSHELIKRVSALPEEPLLSYLSSLKESALLVERGIYPQTSYVFRHALTREVVYNSILTQKKKELHARIGTSIEELYKNSLAAHYEVLAEHFLMSESYAKAAEYFRLAGRKAEKTASLFRAISFAQQRIACLEKLDQTADLQKKIIDARTGLGLYCAQMNQKKAKEAIDPIVNIALKLDYRKRLCQIYTILGIYHGIVTEDWKEAYKTLEHALKISEESGDFITLVLASYYYAGALAFNCEFDRAEEYFRKSYEINLAVGSLWGASAMLSTLSYATLLPRGKIEEAFRTTEKAIELAEKSGDVFSKGTAYVSHGISCFYKGFLPQAEVQMAKGFDLSNAIPLYWYAYARLFLGIIYSETGDFSKSEESLQNGISVLTENELNPSLVNFGKVALTRTKVMNRDKNIDWGFLDLAISNNKLKPFETLLFKFLGDIFLYVDDGHLSEAEHWYARAIEAGERNGMVTDVGRAMTHVSYAELYRRKGEGSKIREQLSKATETFKECGADGWVEKYEKELAKLV
jgi:class 3 adenylate cyclase/tetratricopeptide (TPR) repeat protein